MRIKQRNAFNRFWQRLVGVSLPAHDRFLSLSITNFNFSTGWDRLLQKERQFGR